MSGDRDSFYMRQALALAERGRGRTSPNPMVSALIVDPDGVIVGRGAHEFFGGAHAEVNALADAADRSRGGTLYCTLEPCTHVGRTGPCAPLVATAGIARVVVANEDPNPIASGGNEFLRARGIEVTSGVLAETAAKLNPGFFTVVRWRRPFITLKVAISKDGMVAAGRGVRTPLTGAKANRYVHRDRAEVDALAVGSGTILTDDPLLTARVAYRRRPLTRVVYDSRLRTPPTARLFSTLADGPVIIVTNAPGLASNPARRTALEDVGATIHVIDTDGPLGASAAALAANSISSMIVEGGPSLHRAFWDGDLVDRVQIFVAPRTIGADGVPWLGETISNSSRVTWQDPRQLGDDVLLAGYVHRAD